MTAAAAKLPAQIDLNLVASKIHVALEAMRGDDTEADRNQKLVERHATVAENARAAAARRRVEIGGLLLEARPLWPERGTGTADHHVAGKLVQRWGEFLAVVKLDDATARRYMDEASDPDAKRGGKRELARVESILAEVRKLGRADRDALLRELRPANVSGGSGETDRGSWVTSKLWAERVGPWDLDPFSNPRSHIVAEYRCMLEDGGDGLAELGHPGCWTSGGSMLADGTWASTVDASVIGGHTLISGVADETTRVWIQPPYDIVEDVIAHYGHTRFCALLRLDSSTAWFAKLWEVTEVIALPKGTREFFEPPPGIAASGNPQPHAFFYADPRDLTPAIAESCILLDRYEARQLPALQVVR